MNNVFNFFYNYFAPVFDKYPLPHLTACQKTRADPSATRAGPSALEKLPKELLLTIFTKLGVAEWQALSRTNTFLANKSISPIVLASLLERELLPPHTLVPLHKWLELTKMAGIFLTKLTNDQSSIPLKITNQEIKQVFQCCPNIQELSLHYLHQLTDEVLDMDAIPATQTGEPQHLTKPDKLLQNLQSLDLSFCNWVTDAFIDRWLPKNLQSLNLSWTSESQLTSASLNNLPQNLKSLDLSFCSWVTDAFIDKLPKSLQSLDLSSCNWVTDAFIDKLPKSLQSLDLRYSNWVTDAIIDKLPKSLVSLDLFGCTGLTGATLDKLPKNLQSLNLTCCEWVTDAIIDKLPKSLVSLDLHGCTGLTEAGRRKVSERLSTTSIRFEITS
jgi:Leucine Rich repeat